MNINELSNTVFTWAKSVGWWDDMNRCPFQTLQLFSTEVAEATEGERKNLMDDKVPHRPMGEVELADVVIRACDVAGRYGWKYEWTNNFKFYYGTKTIGAMHLSLNKCIINLADITAGSTLAPRDAMKTLYVYDHPFSLLIDTCFAIAEFKHYDLEGAIVEKLEFNRTRADHKRENRVKAGGKEF